MEWSTYLWIYVLINFVLSLYIYYNQKKFYVKKFIKKERLTPDLIDVHDEYPEFRKTDQLSYLRLFIGLNMFFWWKLIILILLTIMIIVSLK
jgi:hypothetical protein